MELLAQRRDSAIEWQPGAPPRHNARQALREHVLRIMQTFDNQSAYPEMRLRRRFTAESSGHKQVSTQFETLHSHAWVRGALNCMDAPSDHVSFDVSLRMRHPLRSASRPTWPRILLSFPSPRTSSNRTTGSLVRGRSACRSRSQLGAPKAE